MPIIAFGFTLIVLVYTVGPISGCHVNPAVTIAMLIAKKIETKDAIPYIIAKSLAPMAAPTSCRPALGLAGRSS